MGTLLENILSAKGQLLTIDQATRSNDRKVHMRAWVKLRNIAKSGGCITLDTTQRGQAQKGTIVANPPSTIDGCKGCAAVNMVGGCFRNNELALLAYRGIIPANEV